MGAVAEGKMSLISHFAPSTPTPDHYFDLGRGVKAEVEQTGSRSNYGPGESLA